MNKKCIFNSNKDCINCGDCNKCDLNSNKKCNNCGKCLELEGYDMKAIKIDEIMEEKNDTEVFENDNCYQVLNDEKESVSSCGEQSECQSNNDDKIEFIDDIDGLREIIEDEGVFKDLTYEEFPGFIRFKTNENN
ncbi:hypothetical protein HBE96_08225 [Clostridium sp. P21]|uniref:Protein containing Zn-finger domain n=1 Tax=Clostridium muellerianum TaxID=2716538 RepID=A0A7Y0EHT8_9CLOT|nr:hypothetical protein [Clostridium muellerianum]NMM62680.1 hypothetical protein [Clostridium muellerianum]